MNQDHRSPSLKRQRFDHPPSWGCAYGRFGSKSDLDARNSNVRFNPMNRHDQLEQRRPKSAANSRSHTQITSSFGQPGLPQSFLVSREVFGIPIRAQHVFEIGNAQCGIELPQPYHRFLCLVQPPG
jgi:hypothetical protein